jgi:spore coat polysaccharide biosynthesis protein SpsF
MIGLQARSKSTRLPGKIYLPVGDKPMLLRIVEICRAAKPFPKVNEYTVAVLGPEGDTDLKEFCQVHRVPLFEGNGTDLVSRYCHCDIGYDAIVRVTSDCPLLPVWMIERVITELMSYDYVTNVSPRSFPDGYDCQGISYEGLEWLDENQLENREHIFEPLDTDPFFLRKFTDEGFTVRKIINSERWMLNPYLPENKLSVDTQEDLERVRKLLATKS